MGRTSAYRFRTMRSVAGTSDPLPKSNSSFSSTSVRTSPSRVASKACPPSVRVVAPELSDPESELVPPTPIVEGRIGGARRVDNERKGRPVALHQIDHSQRIRIVRELDNGRIPSTFETNGVQARTVVTAGTEHRD